MKKLNLNFWMILSIFLSIGFTSCDDNDDDFDGKNEIFLLAKGEETLIESEDKEIVYDVQLTKTVTEDVTIGFEFKLADQVDTSIVKFVENPIVIKAGSKTAVLKVVSKKNEFLTEDANFSICLKSCTDENISLNAVAELKVQPSPKVVPLTEEQKKLIEKYKTSKNLDLSHWIGVIPVEVKIIYPGGGYLNPFSDAYEKTIKGKTVITLSEKATADLPALKMVSNPMGLTEYMYQIFKDETILDNEFWLETPAAQSALELTGLSADSEEEFKVSIDSLVFNSENNTVDFVTNNVALDAYGDFIKAVGFDFSYTACDRMNALIDNGNQSAIDAEEQGGSLNPNKYINNTSIDTDGWGGENYVKPTSLFNTETGELKFTFNFDHYNGGDYVKVEVTYSSIKIK
jgi:hypothetical protein